MTTVASKSSDISDNSTSRICCCTFDLISKDSNHKAYLVYCRLWNSFFENTSFVC